MTDQVSQVLNGCSTMVGVIIVQRNLSSASLNNLVTDDKSLSQKPNLLHQYSETTQVGRDLPPKRCQAGA